MSLLDSLLRRRRPRPASPQTIISRKIGKAVAALVLAGGAALFGIKAKQNTQGLTQAQKQNINLQVEKTDTNYEILNAIKNSTPLSHAIVKKAQVIKLLRNDNKGAKHQRWIIQIENGVTITIVHNIDIAEKVPVSPGDIIEAAGELIFGDRKKDPILHWTHADPNKKYIDGYILLNGKKYGDIQN